MRLWPSKISKHYTQKKLSGWLHFIPMCVFVTAMVGGMLIGAGLASVTQGAKTHALTPETAFWSEEEAKLIRFSAPQMPIEVPDRFKPTVTLSVEGQSSKPRIAIVIDDLGWSPTPVRRLMAMDVPITYSFLPYAVQSQELVNDVLANGDEVMLHLPMQASGARITADGNGPGPDTLKTSMNSTEVRAVLMANLEKFDGYVGVNNHMGSAFTKHIPGMQVVLAELEARNLYFLDSVTSGSSKVETAASSINVPIIKRDVFLDADFGKGGAGQVYYQLERLEQIAQRHGSAIAIAHPYPTTLEALEVWSKTVEARGYEVVHASAMMPASSRKPKALSKLR